MRQIKLLITFLALSIAVYAQNGKVSSKTGIKKGLLKNGLTYYVYNNPASHGKVNFYLMQDVGAILEEDNQNGLAHFLEHMCFNGTKNFPGNTIMEKFSAKSLTNSINAYTGVDQTVYHLTNIPSNDQAFLDECLLILYDWCNNVTLAPDKIEAERPVILEEMRTRNNIGFRVSAQTSPAMFNNSKYSKRNIIGPAEVIKNFKHEELVDFYNTWYHTGLQSVVVIGDIDPIETEEKIRNLFSTLPKLENPKERYHIEIPDNQETHFVEVRDEEIKGSSVRIVHRHAYHESIEQNYISLMLNSMLQKRVKKLLKDDKDKDKNQAESFVQLAMSFAPVAYGYANYSIDISYKDGKAENALNTALGMQKDILQNGFTQEEFESTQNNMLKSLRRLKNAKGMMSNQYHFDNIQNNFINKINILDASSNLQAFEKLLKDLTLDDFRQKLNEWYSGPNKSIIVMGGKQDELLTEQEILDLELNCEAVKIIPEKDDDEDETAEVNSLIKDELKGAEIVKTEKLSDFLAEKWTLENGATVIYKECNANPDLINIFAISPGGLSVMNGKKLINATAFSSFIPAMGIKGYSEEQLKKLMETNKIKASPKLSQRDEELFLMSNYANLETAFQILYNQFENPDLYKDKFDELYEKLVEKFKKAKLTHQNSISDTISLMRYGPDRFQPIDTSWFQNITFEAMTEVYKDRFQDAGNFTFYIVGGVGKSKAKKMAQKYIGSIPSTGRNEEVRLVDNLLENGRTKRTYSFDIPGKQAGVIYNIDLKADYSFKNKLSLSMMQAYLQEQLHNEIREKQRGTYGVHVMNKIERNTTRNANFDIRFECDPERAEELDEILHASVVSLCEKGISQADFEIVKKKFDKPQQPPQKSNLYYIGMIREFEMLGTNNDEADFYKNTLDSIDRDYLNTLFKDLIENAAILDIIYLPK